MSALFAQSVTGIISGTVIDPSGLAIAKADVLLIQPSTGFERRTVSAENGGFVFPGIDPGNTTSRSGATDSSRPNAGTSI